MDWARIRRGCQHFFNSVRVYHAITNVREKELVGVLILRDSGSVRKAQKGKRVGGGDRGQVQGARYRECVMSNTPTVSTERHHTLREELQGKGALKDKNGNNACCPRGVPNEK